jgi:hypothetical protein
MNYKQIVQDQKEELQGLDTNLLIAREAEKNWENPTQLIQIITGVRRSGKSTLALLHLTDTDFGYVNFDDERLADLKSAELNDLLSAVYEVYGDINCFFFDEIQNAENWSLFVNRLQRTGNSMVITGSNSKLLSTELASHLTGRYKTIELFPFSFREFLVAKGIEKTAESTREKAIRKKIFDEYYEQGGFPEIFRGEEPLSYARNLFYSIINRDIIYRYKVQHTRAFKEMATYLVLETGKEISYNRIKNIFSLGSAHTARNYVDHLEEAYIISTLEKFSYKKQESLRYRKTYVIDIAFYRCLSPTGPANKGFIYETLVFLDLLRRKTSEGIEIFYYKGIQEVDFVVKKNQELVELIQVCHDLSEEKTMNREVKALLEASESLKCSRLTILNEHVDEERAYQGKTIRFIPIIDWLITDI